MTEPATGASSKRIIELDGLRGLAILLVLLWHCVGSHMDLSQGWSLTLIKCLNLTWTGVDLFFVLSGFLIGGLMFDNGGASNFFKVFYARRALRILPPYYLLLIGYAGVSALGLSGELLMQANESTTTPPLWVFVTFLQNFFFAVKGGFGTPWLAATWSLAVEEQFYLCLPLLIFLVPRVLQLPALLGLIASAPLFRMVLFDLPPQPGYAVYLLMPGRADALLLGVLGAWMMRHEPDRRWLEEHVSWLRAALLVLLAGVAVLHQSYLGYISFPMLTIGYTWLALFYCCLLLVAILERRGPLKWILRLAPLRYLGRISYTLYLIHVPVSAVIYGTLIGGSTYVHTVPEALALLLALLIPIGLAALSWHLLEHRLLRYGHSLCYRFEPKSAKAIQATRIVGS